LTPGWVHDCWFLLHQDVPIDPALFARKMDVLGKSARVRVSIDDEEWDRDLSVLVEHPPAYETVIETVTEALDDAGVPVQIGPK
jgi:hypothetical protein